MQQFLNFLKKIWLSEEEHRCNDGVCTGVRQLLWAETEKQCNEKAAGIESRQEE